MSWVGDPYLSLGISHRLCFILQRALIFEQETVSDGVDRHTHCLNGQVGAWTTVLRECTDFFPAM